jgi:prepilin-type N-terminal cleavage/methylation domain-containing protein
MTRRLRRLIASQSGYTMIELLQVVVILGVVLGALMTLFVTAMNSEAEMNRRFLAQQDARLAVDRMRREIHCASALTPTGASASITITLPSQCPTAGGTLGGPPITVVYDTELVATNRYRLRRAGVRVADYVTAGSVFNYTAPATGKRGNLRVDLPVNVRPSETGKTWRLVADIVLRNTARL